jgi:hypothetical protein
MYERQRPDWVMCGIPIDGKVGILASTDLTQAELEGVRDDFDLEMLGILDPVRSPRMRHTLTVRMDAFVLVVADTYEQAFRSLFQQWTPRQAARPQLDGGRRGIGA